MRVTKELREKLVRQVVTKYEKIISAENKEYDNFVKELKEKTIDTIIEKIHFHLDQELKAVLVKTISPYGSHNSLKESLEKHLRMEPMKEFEVRKKEHDEKIDSLKEKRDLEIENLLIAISYEKNLERVKELFAENGLTF